MYCHEFQCCREHSLIVKLFQFCIYSQINGSLFEQIGLINVLDSMFGPDPVLSHE
ncbi:hypothetical protein Scep_004537 [Stephania cephalantha]|uniref:Uncharacterized protein n=1 Tax=Stephania cephalantha TaxID=152367 RepID=A0AAP0KSN1_9MAGN